MRRAALLAALALAAGAFVAACGDDDSGRPRLVVSAASSLTAALTRCGREFDDATVRFQFAGSDELATQIRRGTKPDVFASANTALPNALAQEGLLERPVRFATNELVIAVPEDSKINDVEDLAQQGTTVVQGSPTVPVGEYTRRVLERLPRDTQLAIVANVRSEEPDVKGVLGKLTQGAADAGFVYASDVIAADGLRAIRLPQALQPAVAYGAGVVRGSKHAAAAREFVTSLLRGACAAELRRAGFGAPPSS